MGSVITLTDREAWDLAAAARGYLLKHAKAASICVVNLAGRTLLSLLMDTAQPYSLHLARLKAEQAASVGRRTRFIRDRVADPNHPYTPALLGIDSSGLVPWAGGVPVFSADGVPLGGIGVSNLSEDQDEACAVHAVESLGYLSDRPA